MPSAPNQQRLYGPLLMAMNAPYRPGDRLAAVEVTAPGLLRKVGPKMIVVDEVHNLLAGSAREQRASLNLLKFLSNQVPCSIVALGTRDALAAVQTDRRTRRSPAAFLDSSFHVGWRTKTCAGFSGGVRTATAAAQGVADLRRPHLHQLHHERHRGVTGAITTLLSRAAEAVLLLSGRRNGDPLQSRINHPKAARRGCRIREHSLGFSSGTTRWDNVVNAAGDTLTVPTSVSGMPSSYDVPINGTHIDGVAQNGLFNNTSIALPGFNSGERALLTGVDIQAICTIEGCAPDQMNTNPSAFALTVPEPGTLPLVGLAIAGLGFMGTYRRRGASQGGYCRDAEDRK